MKMLCPHCGLGGIADTVLYGKKVRCPECQKIFRVTDEVIVGGNSSKGQIVEQNLVGDDELQPAGNIPAEEHEANSTIDTCSKCGFQFSSTFIRDIDGQRVCPACAEE